jgi:hypothetical protein
MRPFRVNEKVELPIIDPGHIELMADPAATQASAPTQPVPPAPAADFAAAAQVLVHPPTSTSPVQPDRPA